MHAHILVSEAEPVTNDQRFFRMTFDEIAADRSENP
jgi:hypothetical protein